MEKVYQFKITLKDTKPAIWRRIQVPETYTFCDLHVAIQNAMGWENYHLHQFNIINPKTGITEDIGSPGGEAISGSKIPLSSYFSLQNKRAYYLYDFGDSWEHMILLEKILPQVPKLKYPICIGGERACPPEDCGGSWGYENLLVIIKNKKHAEHRSTMEWLGEPFNPAEFKLKNVHFDNPKND